MKLRHLFVLILTITLAGALLAACKGRAEKPKDGIVHLELWQPFNFEETTVFKQIMADFEKDYEARHGKKIKVDVQYVAYGDMFTKLRTAALANITPDVAFLDSIKATDLALGQALVPINELAPFKEHYGTIEKAREEFVGGSFDAGVVNRAGKVALYGYPVQSTTVALFWNKEMFRNKAAELRAAGLSPDRAPEDWDEMVAYGKVLTEKDGSVFGFGMSSSLWFNFPIFNMYGVDFVKYDAEGRATPEVDTPNGKAALARMQSIALSGVEGGAWKRSALGPDQGFINRRYAMAMTGPWNVENFSAGGLEFDIALIPQPTAAEVKALGLPPRGKRSDGRDTWSSSNIGGQTGVILRSCEERDAAFEVLEYFTSEPVQRRWASTLGQIPTRKAAWKDLDMSKYPYMKIFMEQIALSKRIPQIPLYGTLENDVFNPQMDLLLQNKQTPESMLKKMDAIITERILSNLNEALEGLKAK